MKATCMYQTYIQGGNRWCNLKNGWCSIPHGMEKECDFNVHGGNDDSKK